MVDVALALLAPQQNGPWNGDLRWAEITGKKASEYVFHIQSSGVPNLLRTKKGEIVAVFQWFPFNESKSWDQVAIQRSSDNGKSWTRPKTIVVEGLPQGYQRPMDPCVVELPDGRLRYYYTSNPEGMGQESNAIYSAISKDGSTWKFEPGRRFQPNDQVGFDPTVTYFDGKWHMITPKYRGGGYHAVSDDGLNFKQIETVEDPGYDWIGNLAVVDGKLTFFGGGAGLWSRAWNQGKWDKPQEYGLKYAGDPAVVSLGNGKWGVLYVGSRPPQ